MVGLADGDTSAKPWLRTPSGFAKYHSLPSPAIISSSDPSEIATLWCVCVILVAWSVSVNPRQISSFLGKLPGFPTKISP